MSFGFGFGLPYPRTVGGGGVGGYLSFVYNPTDTSLYQYLSSASVVNADKTITEFGVFGDTTTFLYSPVVNKLSTTGALTSQLAGIGAANFSANGAGALYAMSLAQDSSGNIYVVAWFESPRAYKLLKFNSSGVYQSGLSLDSFAGSVTPYSGLPNIAIDASNNILIVGGALSSGAMLPLITVSTALSVTSWQFGNNYSITIANSDKASAVIASNIQSAAGVVIGFAKYNGVAITTTSYVQSKTNAWTKQNVAFNTASYPYTDTPIVNADSSGNVYMAVRNTDTFISYVNLSKLNSSGVLQWQRQTVDIGSLESPSAICFDSSDNVYFVWSLYDGTTDNLRIFKYNSAGTLQWARVLYESVFGTLGIYANSAVISSNDPNYIYLTGTVYDIPSGGVWSQVFKVPTNGTGTGTFTVAGWPMTYAADTQSEVAGTNAITVATNAAYTTTTGTSSAYSQTFSTTTALTSGVAQI
jgi:hypothetical protein